MAGRVIGHYESIGRSAPAAWAQVYVAHDVELGRTVASRLRSAPMPMRRRD